MSTNFHIVNNSDHFKELLSKDLNRVSLLNFWAPWAEPCQQMNQVVLELSKKHDNLLVLQIDAEEHEEISESFEIESVPSFIILRGHTLLGRTNGADAKLLTEQIATHTRAVSLPLSRTDEKPAPAPMFESEDDLHKRLRGLMNQDKVVLFMKGMPDAPRCGFSRQTVELLRDQGVEKFAYFDILTDESVRQGLKKLNDWPTFPQLIINGEFVGGLDVIKEMVHNGEFQELITAA